MFRRAECWSAVRGGRAALPGRPGTQFFSLNIPFFRTHNAEIFAFRNFPLCTCINAAEMHREQGRISGV